MAGLRVHFVFPPDLVERVDAALAEGQSRGEFVRRAVEQALGPGSGEAFGPAAVKGANVAPVSPAPAERPFKMGRVDQGHDLHGPVEPSFEPPFSRADAFRQASSSAAKRDVRPVPKKGEK